MADPRVEKLAKTMVEYSVKVKPKDWVVISTSTTAEPLAAEVLRYVLQAGGYPSIQMGSDRFAEIVFAEANDDQLKHITPFDRLPFEEAPVFIALNAAENTRNLSGSDPKKLQTRSAARKRCLRHLYEAQRQRRSALDTDELSVPCIRPRGGYEPGGLREFCLQGHLCGPA